MQIYPYLAALIGVAGLVVLAYGFFKYPIPDATKRYAGDAAQETHVKAKIAIEEKRYPYTITGVVLIIIAVVSMVILIKIAS